MVIKIIILYHAMMKPIRDGEFEDFKSSLFAIMPLFFFLQMITLTFQDGAPYICMICWISIKIGLAYMISSFLETWFFMNLTGYFLLLLLANHMKTITALSNQMGELLASQKEKQLFCAGWLQGLKNMPACKVLWRFGEWQYKGFPSWGCPL